MKLQRNARIFRGQWDPIPLVSVFFLLLLFLALESRMAFVPGVSIDLPEGGSPPPQAGATLMVAMDRLGRLYYENQMVDEGELLASLRTDAGKLEADVTLIVLADKGVTYERLTRLKELAQRAGIKALHLATRRDPIGPGVRAAPTP